MKKMVYIGDVIIVNDKDNISDEENRVLLENGHPYFVSEIGTWGGNFYIRVYGKEITLSEDELEYLELIEIAERYSYNKGDSIIITDIQMIECAEENGFHQNDVCKVSNIINDEIIISNGSKELWIKGGEIRYIKPYETKTAKDVVVEDKINNTESKMNQELIDELLDKKDFIALKEMVESNQ